MDNYVHFDGEYADIPELTQRSILRYVLQKIPPGSFLTAVLCNDLYNATGRADANNLVALPLIVRWFANKCPHLYGADNMKKHLDQPTTPRDNCGGGGGIYGT
jgi:hypothetical protein